MVKMGCNKNARYALNAISSPIDSEPPITSAPPKPMTMSVPRLAKKNTSGKLLDKARTVITLRSRSSALARP